MSTIALELTPELEQHIQSEAAKQGLDLKHYILNTLSHNLKQIPLTELDLLQKINAGLSSETWDKYHLLISKRRAETLDIQEQSRLIEISDRIEQWNVQRLSALVELAKLRNTSLLALMQDLGINLSEHD
jgi:hypothetical protein